MCIVRSEGFGMNSANFLRGMRTSDPRSILQAIWTLLYEPVLGGVRVAGGVQELVFLTSGSTVDTVHASASCSVSVLPQE